MAKSKSNGPSKSQWWASIIYPNKNISIEYINDVVVRFHLPCIISPLHNRDSIDGYPIKCGLRGEIIEDVWKKPHFHIMFMFPRAVGKKTYKYIIERFEEYGITLVGKEMIGNGTSMARYFVHMDNPEKHQYNVKDILYFGGLNDSLLQIEKFNKFQGEKLRNALVQVIINNRLVDVIDVYMYLQSIGETMLSDYALKNTAMVEKFCRANYYRYNPRVPPRQKHEGITYNIS